MTTTTHREYKSVPIPAGATREAIVTAFDDATLTIQDRITADGGEALWDMMQVEYQPEEVQGIMTLGSDEPLVQRTYSPTITISVPVVVTS